MSRREIAPHGGVRRVELRSLGEQDDGAVDLAGQDVFGRIVAQRIGGASLRAGRGVCASALLGGLFKERPFAPGLDPWSTDQTPLSGTDCSLRSGEKGALLRGSLPATRSEEEDEEEAGGSKLRGAEKCAGRPSKDALQACVAHDRNQQRKQSRKGESMSSIPLRIALHGLIALAPHTDQGGVNHMTALLLDGRTSHGIQAECESQHFPELRFLVAQTKQCLDAGCKTSGFQCNCLEEALERKQVTLEFSPALDPAGQPLSNDLPTKALPEDRDEAASFAYVANLAKEPFGLTLNPEYLTDAPPEHLLARIKFPFDSATACSLAIREDRGEANVHALNFRVLHDLTRKTDKSQALAQRVVLELGVPAAATVTLRIRAFDGTTDHPITLRAGGSGYKIDFANEPNAPIDRDHPCNDGVARHFAMFYELANNPPLPDKRLLPHVSFTQWVNEPSIRPLICDDPFFAMGDRPICPMASFNP